MDHSGQYYWPPNNLSDNDRIVQQQSLDEYLDPQHSQVIQQSIQQTDGESSSPKQTIDVSTSSPSIDNYSDKIKVDDRSGGVLPIEIVNPDAIEPKARSYTCRICQVTFPNKSAVTVHSRIHTDHQGKPYRCNFCNKGFSTNFYLKQHERIHSGAKPYKCPMCDNSFKQLSHVQQHVRTHTGVRPYKCHWPGCGKAFLQQSHLKSHEARHEPKTSNGSKPYKCHWPDCGKNFAQFSNLKSHLARHNSKSKSKKGVGGSMRNLAGKSSQHDGISSSNFSSTSDVINQAAAAADIVPAFITEDEAEIRPFLCPGCSKLYVREATFKKHLEECKTKLQQSISATATALGINPPPLPRPESNGMIIKTDEFNNSSGDRSLIISRSSPVSSRETTGCSSAKKQRLLLKSESSPSSSISTAHQQQSMVSTHSQLNLHNLMSSTGIIPTSDIKQETSVSDIATMSNSSTTSFVNDMVSYKVTDLVANNDTQQLIFNTSPNDGKLQEVITYRHGDIQVPSRRQIPVSNPSSVLVTSVNHTSSDAHRIASSTSEDSVMSQSVLNTRINEQKESVLEASTINQSAIKWQWDQPVPRLNYP